VTEYEHASYIISFLIKIDWIARRFYYAFVPGRGGERAKVKKQRVLLYAVLSKK